MNRFVGLIRRCIEDYSMINAGDRIAVGVSGGKDSLALLCALAELKKYYPKPFSLYAVTLDMGYDEMDFTPVRELCRRLQVPYAVRHTQIKQIVFEQRNEKNPCALCAKMRRGALCDMLNEMGLNKIALGHHFDDAIETFFLSLFYEGRLSCFEPVTNLSRSGIQQIRPMLYVGEGTVRAVAEKLQLPVIKNPCPMDVTSKRHEVKKLTAQLTGQYPDLKNKVFGAMQRLPLNGWAPQLHERQKSEKNRMPSD